ncbi:Neutral/alkaline non-lysosomal ceramidase-domain-containing protein [Mycena rosella]|uniref:ceramidase n=1 Tax=Mycena rosella TaxID=1033263 RepID=A0AAD7G744_MYCRO|nr:Neutral/alkaline non-lysosomal ceramidase-domain-containing protein [Mycena rosella]
MHIPILSALLLSPLDALHTLTQQAFYALLAPSAFSSVLSPGSISAAPAPQTDNTSSGSRRHSHGDTGVRRALLAALVEEFGGMYNDRNVALVGTHQHSGVGGYLETIPLSFYETDIRWSGGIPFQESAAGILYLLPQLTSLGLCRSSFDAIVDGAILATWRAPASLAPGTLAAGWGWVEGGDRNRTGAICGRRRRDGRPRVGDEPAALWWRRGRAGQGARAPQFLRGARDVNIREQYAAAENPTAMPGDASYVAGFIQGAVGDTIPNPRPWLYPFPLSSFLALDTGSVLEVQKVRSDTGVDSDVGRSVYDLRTMRRGFPERGEEGRGYPLLPLCASTWRRRCAGLRAERRAEGSGASFVGVNRVGEHPELQSHARSHPFSLHFDLRLSLWRGGAPPLRFRRTLHRIVRVHGARRAFDDPGSFGGSAYTSVSISPRPCRANVVSAIPPLFRVSLAWSGSLPRSPTFLSLLLSPLPIHIYSDLRALVCGCALAVSETRYVGVLCLAADDWECYVERRDGSPSFGDASRRLFWPFLSKPVAVHARFTSYAAWASCGLRLAMESAAGDTGMCPPPRGQAPLLCFSSFNSCVLWLSGTMGSADMDGLSSLSRDFVGASEAGDDFYLYPIFLLFFCVLGGERLDLWDATFLHPFSRLPFPLFLLATLAATSYLECGCAPTICFQSRAAQVSFAPRVEALNSAAHLRFIVVIVPRGNFNSYFPSSLASFPYDTLVEIFIVPATLHPYLLSPPFTSLLPPSAPSGSPPASPTTAFPAPPTRQPAAAPRSSATGAGPPSPQTRGSLRAAKLLGGGRQGGLNGDSKEMTQVTGSVRSAHAYVDMSRYEFVLGNGTRVQTCPAAMGYSFAGGRLLFLPRFVSFHPSFLPPINTFLPPSPLCFSFGPAVSAPPNRSPRDPFREIVKKFWTPAPPPEQIACHYPKPILLNTAYPVPLTFACLTGQASIGRAEIECGYAHEPYKWSPSTVDVQILTVDNVGTRRAHYDGRPPHSVRARRAGGVTVAYVLIDADREAVRAELISSGILGKDAHLVVAGPANTYAHYITTRKEYNVQRHEGASTLYGPYIDTYIDKYTSLVTFLADGASGTPPSDEPPAEQISKAISLQTDVKFDAVPIGKHFGQISKDVVTSELYHAGDTVFAEFAGANPRDLGGGEVGFTPIDDMSGALLGQLRMGQRI